MLHSSGQPKFLWGEAACHAIWFQNCTSTKALNNLMPPKAATGKKPDLQNLHKWGYQMWVWNKASAKLGGQVDEGVWVGYDNRLKGS